jgi:hypothetical protein
LVALRKGVNEEPVLGMKIFMVSGYWRVIYSLIDSWPEILIMVGILSPRL